MSKISEFQIYISENAPFNIEYKVKKLGVMDNDLFSALKKIESEISSMINIKGMIVSNEKKIVGTVEDVKRAIKLVVGFQKNAQANMDAIDMALKDEEIPTAAKSQLSADEALSQFESVTPTESQQIGRSHIDAVGGGEVCGKCGSPIKADICDICGNRNRIHQVGFLVSEYLKKIAQLNGNSNFVKMLSNFIGTELTKDEVEHWATKNSSVLKYSVLNHFWYGRMHFLEAFYDTAKSIRVYKISHPEFSASQEMYLQNDGKIPKLYMYIGGNEAFYNYDYSNVPKDENGDVLVDKNLLHDYYLLEAFSVLFGFSLSSKNDVNIVKEFIKENKSKIDQIGRLFKTKPEYLGGGADGVAFSIGPDLILKLFTDNYSYNKAVQAVNRLHKEPELAKTEAMIYDVGELGKLNQNKVYYYIMEKMKPVKIQEGDSDGESYLNSLLSRIAFYVLRDKEKWIDLKEKLNDPKNHVEIKNIVLEAVSKISDALRNKNKKSIVGVNKEYPSLRSGWLESLVEEIIIKFLTGRVDLHTGNLGVTNYGEFRYFDPAFQPSEDSTQLDNLNLVPDYHAANRKMINERFVKLAEIIRKY